MVGSTDNALHRKAQWKRTHDFLGHLFKIKISTQTLGFSVLQSSTDLKFLSFALQRHSH